ncbi:MAG: phosphatase PAP2 family protein [Thermoplasmata archaeon]|nr:phosphatase PAP2 family protein [Thermoplasmata archaeon]
MAHKNAPFAFEKPAFRWLGPPSARETWRDLADVLGAPAVGVALAASLLFGFFRRAFLRVVVYAALAAAALLVSEQVVKPHVQRILDTEFTFPSGHVTAVSATALALWLALYPLLSRRARVVTLVVGVVWTLLMSLAVIGAQWHTPLDALGSIFLSVGVVAGGAGLLEPADGRSLFLDPKRARVGDPGGG